MQCIEWLLSEKSAEMDSNAVLDFLWAVERLRMLWRGRELVSERCRQYILNFTVSQMTFYIEHFVREATGNKNSLLDFRLTQLFHFMRASDFSPDDFEKVTEMVEKKGRVRTHAHLHEYVSEKIGRINFFLNLWRCLLIGRGQITK